MGGFGAPALPCSLPCLLLTSNPPSLLLLTFAELTGAPDESSRHPSGSAMDSWGLHCHLRVHTGVMPDQAAAETADRALLTPVLRTVGNVAAGGGAAAVSQLLGYLSGTAQSMISSLLTILARRVFQECTVSSAPVHGRSSLPVVPAKSTAAFPSKFVWPAGCRRGSACTAAVHAELAPRPRQGGRLGGFQHRGVARCEDSRHNVEIITQRGLRRAWQMCFGGM